MNTKHLVINNQDLREVISVLELELNSHNNNMDSYMYQCLSDLQKNNSKIYSMILVLTNALSVSSNLTSEQMIRIVEAFITIERLFTAAHSRIIKEISITN